MIGGGWWPGEQSVSVYHNSCESESYWRIQAFTQILSTAASHCWGGTCCEHWRCELAMHHARINFHANKFCSQSSTLKTAAVTWIIEINLPRSWLWCCIESWHNEWYYGSWFSYSYIITRWWGGITLYTPQSVRCEMLEGNCLQRRVAQDVDKWQTTSWSLTYLSKTLHPQHLQTWFCYQIVTSHAALVMKNSFWEWRCHWIFTRYWDLTHCERLYWSASSEWKY